MVCVFGTHLKSYFMNKKHDGERKSVPMNVWFVGKVYRMFRKFGNRWVKCRDTIDLMDHPSNARID